MESKEKEENNDGQLEVSVVEDEILCYLLAAFPKNPLSY